MHIVKVQKNKGFTLVELLVVISIIGILASFAMVSLNGARMSARDALRKGDMVQMRTALNMFYNNNGQYLECDEGGVGTEWDTSDPHFESTPENGSDCYNALEAALVDQARPYLASLPMDPKNPTNDDTVSTEFLYRYKSNGGGEEFVLIYYLEEDPTVPQIIRGF